MLKPDNKTLSVITIQTCEQDDTHTMFPNPTKLAVKLAQITLEKFSENLSDFISMLNVLVEKLPDSCGNYGVDELTFSLSVTQQAKFP